MQVKGALVALGEFFDRGDSGFDSLEVGTHQFGNALSDLLYEVA